MHNGVRNNTLWASTTLLALAVMAVGYANHVPVGQLDAKRLDNQITRLQARIDSGAVKLEFTPERGYLESLLRALGIPVSSQILVFSKTSLQRDIISPRTPRAIYFNDKTYVAWMPGAGFRGMVPVYPASLHD